MRMLKKVAVLMTVIMIMTICTSCGSSSRSRKAVEPYTGDPVVLETEFGPFDLLHIDTETFPDKADRYLDMCYDVLDSLKIKGDINAMWNCSMGLATEAMCIDPVIIDTDATKDDPLFLVVYRSGNIIAPVGTFRKSDAGSTPFSELCFGLFNETQNRVVKELGLDGDDHVVHFAGVLVDGLKFKSATSEIEALYNDTYDHYFRVCFGAWYDDTDWSDYVQYNGMALYRITCEGINSKEDVLSYLREDFTDELAQNIWNSTDERIYAEADGHLFVAGLGIGSPIDITDEKVLGYAENGNKMFMIIEITKDVYNSKWTEVIGQSYEDYLLIYDKVNGAYRCCEFSDPIFRYFGYHGGM